MCISGDEYPDKTWRSYISERMPQDKNTRSGKGHALYSALHNPCLLYISYRSHGRRRIYHILHFIEFHYKVRPLIGR